MSDKEKLRAIIDGLLIFEEFGPDDIQITEVGNYLHVWSYYDNMNLDSQRRYLLEKIGWTLYLGEEWTYPLSG